MTNLNILDVPMQGNRHVQDKTSLLASYWIWLVFTYRSNRSHSSARRAN